MIGNVLKKLRENCGYTQQQVADALNIDRSTYTYYETGKTTPDINAIVKLSKIFNASYMDIFEAQERDGGSSLNDSGGRLIRERLNGDKKMVSYIYELSKEEKTLICLFRVLQQEAKREVFEWIANEVEKGKCKKKK